MNRREDLIVKTVAITGASAGVRTLAAVCCKGGATTACGAVTFCTATACTAGATGVGSFGESAGPANGMASRAST